MGKSVLSWDKILDRRSVKRHSLKRLLFFVHHPDVMFKFDAWVVPKSKIFKPAFRKKVGHLTPPKIPIADNLLHRYEDIDINTGRKKIWLELRLEDFEEIKKFWIAEYADSELYQTIKEIIDLTSSNEHIYKKFCNHFRRLIHGNLIAFTTDFKESKEIYLIYWLNFICCFIKECLFLNSNN